MRFLVHRKFLAVALVVSCLSGCLQVYNSSTSDESRYGGSIVGDSTPAGQRFAAAFQIIRDNCAACHPFATLTSDQDWKVSGYVVQGDPMASTIYQALRGSGATSCNNPDGCVNMPDDGALNPNDIATIREWIEQMP